MNLRDFRKIIRTISYFGDSTVRVVKDGILFEALDPTHIAAYRIYLDDIDFEMQINPFTFDPEAFLKFLRGGSATKRIRCQQVGAGEESSLTIFKYHKNVLVSYSDSTYENPEEINIPSLTWDVSFEVDPQEFREIISVAHRYYGYIRFIALDKFLIGFDREQKNEFAALFENTKVKSEKRVESMFSTEYLKNITNITGVFDILKIYLGNDMPVKLEYSQREGDTHAVFLLAPRVVREKDEENE